MSLIKPISYWQQQVVSAVTPPAGTPYLFLNGYNFYQWNGTRLGSTSTGGVAKVNLSGSLDTTWTNNANPSGTTQVRFSVPLSSSLFADSRTTSGNRIRKIDLNTGTIVATTTVGNSIWNMQAREGNTFFTATGDKGFSVGGTAVNAIAKINDDLTLDTTFNTNIGGGGTGGGSPAGFADSSFISSNRIAVFGRWATWNGSSTYDRFVVLNYDGTTDTSFSRTGAFGGVLGGSSPTRVNGGCYQNGLWIVGGSFTTYNSNTRNGIVAFNPDGSENSAFATNSGTGFNAVVYGVRPYGTTQILVIGEFTSYNGTSTNKICVLNTDGTFAFNPFAGTGYTGVPFYPAYDSYLDKWYVVGDIISDYNGTSINNFIPLNGNYSINSGFTYGSGMQTSAPADSAGGGNFLVRL